MKQNWKTTVLGVLTIAGVLVNAGISALKGQHIDLPVLFAGVTSGWGLIHAADAKP
jgi:hypothetical protein